MSGRRFAYKAIDSRGQTMEGLMDADSQEEVGGWLADRRYFVIDIAPAPLSAITAPSKWLRISNKEMNYFLLQLSSLINAGCPLILSLHALHRQLPHSDLKTLLKDLKEKIESGRSLSDALKGHPKIFSNLFITMVEVGEVGGILDEVLERYSQMYDSMFRIRANVIKSMIYPAILLVMTLVVSWALLVWVFPGFVAQFKAHGQLLPTPTRIVLAISNILTGQSLWIFGGGGLIAVLFYLIRQSAAGGRFISGMALKIPFLSAVVKHIQLSLFARILGTLLKCGVPILTSLQAVERAIGNKIFKDALRTIREGVARGESLSKGLGRRRDLFPDSLILMADVGERGGSTGEMLEKAGVIYERDLETTIESLVSLIQPLLVIFLSVFVVLIALAMYLPLFDIIKVVR